MEVHIDVGRVRPPQSAVVQHKALAACSSSTVDPPGGSLTCESLTVPCESNSVQVVAVGLLGGGDGILLPSGI